MDSKEKRFSRMIMTTHAKERGNERLGLAVESFTKLSQKALSEGLKHSDCSGSLKRYFDALYMEHKNANNTRIYGEFVYLFCGKVLITVLHLPNQFKNIVAKKKRQCEL